MSEEAKQETAVDTLAKAITEGVTSPGISVARSLGQQSALAAFQRGVPAIDICTGFMEVIMPFLEVAAPENTSKLLVAYHLRWDKLKLEHPEIVDKTRQSLVAMNLAHKARSRTR